MSRMPMKEKSAYSRLRKRKATRRKSSMLSTSCVAVIQSSRAEGFDAIPCLFVSFFVRNQRSCSSKTRGNGAPNTCCIMHTRSVSGRGGKLLPALVKKLYRGARQEMATEDSNIRISMRVVQAGSWMFVIIKVSKTY